MHQLLWVIYLLCTNLRFTCNLLHSESKKTRLYTKLCQWFLFLMKKFLLVKYRSKMNGVKVPFYWILSEI